MNDGCGMSILDQLAEDVSNALIAEGVADTVIVTRSETIGDTPYDPGSGETTQVEYTCQGWRDQYEQDMRDGTLIQANDVRVMIVASTLSITPTTADDITIDGRTFGIVSVQRDPAGALWDVQARA